MLAVFFFFSKSTHTRTLTCFFQTHIEKHDRMFFVRVFFDLFFCFLFFFFIKDRLCTYRCYMPLTNPVGCWHGTMYSMWVWNREKQHKRQRYWEDEKVRQKKEALTKRPALVLEMESVIIFGATRCMHKQCVFCNTDNPTTLQRARLFEYNM